MIILPRELLKNLETIQLNLSVTFADSLNDRANNGLFFEEGSTIQGNNPAEELGCVKISQVVRM